MTATTLAATLRDSARWADYGNDGYDRAASGRYSAYSNAAGLVDKLGVTAELVDILRGKAAASAAGNDMHGYDSYNPFYAGAADAYRKAADTVASHL